LSLKILAISIACTRLLIQVIRQFARGTLKDDLLSISGSVLEPYRPYRVRRRLRMHQAVSAMCSTTAGHSKAPAALVDNPDQANTPAAVRL
jgi:hypothetical protein